MSIELFLVIAIVAGLPIVFGPAFARRAGRRCLVVSRLFEDELIARGLNMNPSAQALVDGNYSISMLVPLIVAGRCPGMKFAKSSGSNQPDWELRRFVLENRWMAPYLVTLVFFVDFAEFIGKPYDLRRWPRALYAAIHLATRDQRGLVRFGLPVEIGPDAEVIASTRLEPYCTA